MRLGVVFAIGILVFLPVAGCLGGGATGTDKGGSQKRGGTTPPVGNLSLPYENPVVLGHEHVDLAEHQVWNDMELIGHDYMGANGPPGGFGEIDIQGDYAYVAEFSAGFAIVDLKDPRQPKVVSHTQVETPSPPAFGHYTADLKVDKTGNWIFLGMELSTTPGVLIYDATNKAAPKLHGFWPSPGKLLGCHMVEYAAIGDQEYVFCAPLDAAVYVGLFTPANAAGVRQIVTVARWAPASQTYLMRFAADPAGIAGETLLSGHDDMTYQLDPLTNKPMLFVSLWGLGVWFVDVSIPAAPLTLGAWIGDGSKFFSGNIHTTMAFKGDDKRIVVAIPEGANPPAMFVIDATNFKSPKLLAEWKALESFKNQDGADEAGTFSMHNFQIVDGKVYLAMYHGGIVVIDLSTPELLRAPNPVASFMPNLPRPDGKKYSTGAWDVVVWNGYLLTGDSNGGFYVAHRLSDPAGDKTYTSFA